jgi:predicted nucleic acid-binding protein
MSTDPLDGPIVVDANVLFSALLRDGATRHLLLYTELDLHTPDHIWDEFDRNRDHLLEKSQATAAAFDLLLDSLRDRLADLPPQLLRNDLDDALEAVGEDDQLDAPYIAATMAIDGALWTQDKRLRDQAPVPVLTTGEIIDERGLP